MSTARFLKRSRAKRRYNNRIEKRTSSIKSRLGTCCIRKICALGGVRFHIFIFGVVQMWYKPISQASETLAALRFQPTTSIILPVSGALWRAITIASTPATWAWAVPLSWSRPWSLTKSIPSPAPRSSILPVRQTSNKHCSPRDTGQFNMTDSSVCLTTMKRNFERFFVFLSSSKRVFFLQK